MVYQRDEILPGVFLTHIGTNKFKTGTFSVSLATQLTRETAAVNAVIPQVLRRGCVSMPDLNAVAARLDSLYGATIEPNVYKKGEIQCVGFRTSFAEDAYLPAADRVLEQTAGMLGELLLSPLTRGGLLLQKYVDSEREKLIEQIRARVNNKRDYSIDRLCELMCPYEDYAVPKLGFAAEAESIHYHKLTQHWHDLLQIAPIELFYCGGAEPARVRDTLCRVLETLPRGEIDYDIGTNVQMSTVEDQPRYFTEEMNVTQGKLALGFRLGDAMEDPDPAAIRVFNYLYGGAVTSKLFMNVREKLSLCYFASSMLDAMKGVMLVTSGIEFENYQVALDAILEQLDAVKQGSFDDTELSAARAAIAGDMRTLNDNTDDLEEYWLARALEGTEYSPDELAVLCEGVTREQVIEVAEQTALDAVYFLKGKEA